MSYITLLHPISISLLLIILPHFFFKFSIAVSSIAQNQTLPDNNSTLVSPNRNFELGFFSPWNSSHRYLGIWFAKVPVRTVVWVANKNSPILDSSGILSLTSSGDIIIISSNKSRVWTVNSSSTNLTFPVVLKLLDNGNLVLNKADSPDDDSFLWQSFDNPCNTLLPGMKLGWDLATNQEWYLTSWRSIDDPSTGEFTYRMNPKGPPSIVLRRGSNIIYRSGPWDGVRFGGAPHSLQQNPVFAPTFVFNSTHVYYTFENTDDSTISRFVVTESGKLTQFLWRETSNQWIDITTLQADPCDEYAKCGNFGVCEFGGAPICGCLTGFTPRLRDDWARFDWLGGCIRETELNCSTPAGFRKFSDMKVPDTYDSFVNGSARNREECEAVCLRSCRCAAYANTPKIGCVLWSGDLLDIRVYGSGGLDLFVKMPLSELDDLRNPKKVALIASLTVASFILLAIVIWFIIRRRTGNKRRAQQHDYPNQDNKESIGDEDVVLPLIDFHAISAATNEFSYGNKVGEGGFGSVYKGVLSTGEEIAVKRLSRDSGQGLHEFKNEVILIAKLQHRNLVRLLGCCIHRDERMLVYEFMPNKSLDHFIFDQTRETSLEWQTRFDIIVGIARGLLYLHRDSRLRIIHRDLKASNVLLDSEMNPKISDFGLARTFGADQYQENTKRVMGTYGYMAPEYAVDGIFSVKSDVFSFGVLVLEIISGKKNRGFYHPDHDLNLLGHAWKLWTEGNPEDFVDASAPSLQPEKVLRCIQVGLLCVQQRADDRPTMSNALFMLESDHLELDQPKQPGFYAERSIFHTDSSSTGNKPDTSNQITDTLLHGR